MKVLSVAILLLASSSGAPAQSTPALVRPASVTTVLSPLTSPTAPSSQILLNQIATTISQRRFAHQVLTLPPAPVVILGSPRIFRAR